MTGRRFYVSIEPTSVEEIVGQTGWALGLGGDSLLNAQGDEVFLRPSPEGYLAIFVDDGVDVSDLLERIPFEEVGDAQMG